MTIAVGLLCSDGLVLAADTLIAGTTRRRASKLWWCRKGPNVVALAGVGDGVVLGRIAHEVARTLSDTMNENDIIEHVEAISAAALMTARQGNPVAGCELLVGVRSTHEGLSLWENDNCLFAPVDGNRHCIGSGSSLGLYLIDWLFKADVRVMSAKAIAAHILEQARRYVPECDGESQIIIVPHSDEEPYSLGRAEIDAQEKQLRALEAAMRSVLVFSPGAEAAGPAGETIERRLQKLEAVASAAQTVYATLKADRLPRPMHTGRALEPAAVLGSA